MRSSIWQSAMATLAGAAFIAADGLASIGPVGDGQRIRISKGNQQATATFNESAVARDLVAIIPSPGTLPLRKIDFGSAIFSVPA